MRLVSLFIKLLVQRLLVFSSKGVLLDITSHYFGHFIISLQTFSVDNFSKPFHFLYKASVHLVRTFMISLFFIEKYMGLITYSFTAQGADSFYLGFLVITTSFSRWLTYGHLFVILWLHGEVSGRLDLAIFQILVVLLRLCRALVCLDFVWFDWNTIDFLWFY